VSLRRRLALGLRNLLRPGQASRELDEEIRSYLDEAADEHAARGLTPEAAARAARLEVGSPASVREEVRGARWESAVESVLADLGYAARRLRATPGSTAVAVLTQAIGIGAAAAILSAVEPVLLRPLPYPEPDRLVAVWDRRPDGSRAEVTFGTFRELATRARSFSALAVLKPWQPTMSAAAPAPPERLEARRVSAAYFEVLGVRPFLGRAFEASEDRADGPRVVVLSHAFWNGRFGADPSIVGRTVTLDGDPYRILGVLPRGLPEAQVLAPMQYDMSQGRAWGHHLRLLARLRGGVGLADAAGELDAIARAPLPDAPRAPWAALPNGLLVAGLRDDLTRGVRPVMQAILAAAGLLLLIANVNVAGLLLARGAQRQGELAVRLALGAGRARLVRQLLTESLLMAALGGMAGAGLALLGLRALLAVSPPDLLRLDEVHLDAGVLAVGAAITALAGIAAGLLPARQAVRTDPQAGLRLGSRRTASAHGRGQAALVVVEVALAFVLLVGSGLLLRSVTRLLAVPPGFEPRGLLTMQVQTAGHRFDATGSTHRFFEEVLASVRALPGVQTAALTSQLPVSGDQDIFGVHFEAAPPARPEDDHGAFRYAVTPGYFETMRIPLRRGRLLTDGDRAGAPLAAVISEAMARRRLPGLDPIGQRLRIGAGDGPPFTVVGVVGDVRQLSLELAASDAVYVTPQQWHFEDGAMSVVVRGGEAPGFAGLASAVRQAIWSVDRDQAVVRVAGMEELVAASAAQRRFALRVFELFGLAALALAAAGIYGVLAGRVAERTREIGVRSALGASRADLVTLVLGQGLRLTAAGVALGAGLAAAASGAIAAMLFGVSPLDPLTFAGVGALLASVASAASGVPAWRAARVEPASTLRAE